jgi:hypothetical protein
MGFLDSAKRALQGVLETSTQSQMGDKPVPKVEFNFFNTRDNRLTPTPSQMEVILDGRQQSDLAECFLGQVYRTSVGWGNGILAVFLDGSGAIYFGYSGHISIATSWKADSVNDFDDPTPLLVGPSEMTFEMAKRYVPSSFPNLSFGLSWVLNNQEMSPAEERWKVPKRGEFVLVTRDVRYYGDQRRRVVVFSGIVVGTCATILRQRCGDSQGW